MSDYTIIPLTKFVNNNDKIDEYLVGSRSICQRYCDDTKDCEAFSYNENNRVCILKSGVGLLAAASDNNSVSVKGPRKSFWWIWILIIFFVFILFLIRCPGNLSQFTSCSK